MLELHGLSNTSRGLYLAWGPLLPPEILGGLTPGGWGALNMLSFKDNPVPGREISGARDLGAGWAEKLWDVQRLTHPVERQGTHFLHTQPDKPAEATLSCRGSSQLIFDQHLKTAIKSNPHGWFFLTKVRKKIRRKRNQLFKEYLLRATNGHCSESCGWDSSFMDIMF